MLTGQLSIGWCNDLVDRERDLAAGRRDKPLVTGIVRPRAVALCCGLAASACVPLSLASGWQAGLAHLAGVAGGWAYDLGLKRTWWSWLPYAVSFALLTAFLTLGLPGQPGAAGLAAARRSPARHRSALPQRGPRHRRRPGRGGARAAAAAGCRAAHR